jgi:hypothetical protein
MNINVKLNHSLEDKEKDSVVFNIQNFKGELITYGTTWTTKNNPIVTLSTTNTINNYKYNYYSYQAASAHEFGHVLGLKDAYYYANGGCQPKSQTEIWYGANSGEIMINNGKAIANDIEMVLCAFKENKAQYFTPYMGAISKAIKETSIYVDKSGNPCRYKGMGTWENI